jgi:hypothetical protein
MRRAIRRRKPARKPAPTVQAVKVDTRRTATYNAPDVRLALFGWPFFGYEHPGVL